MLLGLGLPEWLTILGLVGGLWLTFWLMARASLAYERRRTRESQESSATLQDDATVGSITTRSDGPPRKEQP